MEENKLVIPKALLWGKEPNKFVRCYVCYSGCKAAPGEMACCTARKNIDGEMQLNNYGHVSSMALDPIEKKPLYHFHPGTEVFSVGGWGCNFKCIHCQNWRISQDVNKEKTYILSPEKLVELAVQHKAKGISWTYNEPCIHLEYTIESAKLAKKEGLYTAYITNGYMSTEALDLIAPYLDSFRVDLKSFDDKFYREICKVKSADGVFNTTLHAKKYGLHIETVTNIIPTKNDSDETMRNIAGWIVKKLGENTPWHVTRFFPCHKLQNLGPTPIETLKKAEKIGRKEGLNFIYLGNTHEKSDTICPNCGKTVISRDYPVTININKDGTCKECKSDLNIKISD